MSRGAPPGRALVCAVMLALGSCGGGTGQPVIYAAASIAGAVAEVAGAAFAVNAASSSTLAQQIAAGARASLFVSAHGRWMDQLDAAGLLVADSRRALVSNELVWIAPVDSEVELDLRPGADRRALLTGRIAIGDPEHVPAGQYARAALVALDLWEPLSGRLATTSDARAALTLVESGAVPVGIVYRTDAMASPAVRVIASMPASASPTVVYEVAVVSRGDSPLTRQLLDTMTGPRGQGIFAEHGFLTDPGPQPALFPQVPEPSGGGGWLSSAELSALSLSMLVGVVATLLALMPATALAFWLARGSGRGRTLVGAIVSLPLVLPPVVVGYFLLLLFSPLGLPFTWLAAALAALVMGFPLMVRALRQSFEGVDRNLEQAAATLGAHPLRVFWTVTLPLSRNGLIAGASLCFARSLGEFGATVTFAGNLMGETRTLPLAIWTALQSPGGASMAWRLTWLCVGLSLVATLISEVLLRRSRARGAE